MSASASFSLTRSYLSYIENTWFDYPRRMRCLSQQSLSVKEVKIFHQIHRCLSCSILNVSDDQETASSYHRYSCEDLYDGALEQDPIGATTPNSRRSASPISPPVKWPRQSNVRSATQSAKLHHSDIPDADDDLNNKVRPLQIADPHVSRRHRDDAISRIPSAESCLSLLSPNLTQRRN
jgi:hypothetical protein